MLQTSAYSIDKIGPNLVRATHIQVEEHERSMRLFHQSPAKPPSTHPPRYEECGNEEFAEAFAVQLQREADGQSRFGAMAVALKKLSDRPLSASGEMRSPVFFGRVTGGWQFVNWCRKPSRVFGLSRSPGYLMLTPPFIALLCRTFITLEGLLADDPKMAEAYNVYQTSLPFAICRFLSPRTRRGGRDLRTAKAKRRYACCNVSYAATRP